MCVFTSQQVPEIHQEIEGDVNHTQGVCTHALLRKGVTLQAKILEGLHQGHKTLERVQTWLLGKREKENSVAQNYIMSFLFSLYFVKHWRVSRRDMKTQFGRVINVIGKFTYFLFSLEHIEMKKKPQDRWKKYLQTQSSLVAFSP